MSLLKRLFGMSESDKAFRAAAARSRALVQQREWLDRQAQVQREKFARTRPLREFSKELAAAQDKAAERDWITSYLDGREATRQSGFTLIELMIVVAIVALLAAIAIPAYSNYTLRAQVSEGMQVADAMKTGVAEYFQNSGNWPTDIVAAGEVATVGKYVNSTNVGSGAITVNYGGQIATALQGANLTFMPYLSSDGQTILWTCGNAPAPTNIAAAQPTDPAGGKPTNATSAILSAYLPVPCRATT